jgi:ribonuclease BN (tRNA processing enzyme)
MNRIIFLGSGGGGKILTTQQRKTGGIYVESGDFSFVLDPGPGSLVHLTGLDLHPEKMKGLVISHHHLDAINDANALIETISDNDKENKQIPFLICEKHCIEMEKKSDPYPYITKYHQGLVKSMFPCSPRSIAKIGPLEVHCEKANHYSPILGYMIILGKVKIGYPADGSYFSGQEKAYDGCDVLIFNVPWPKGHDAPKGIHMTLDDAISFVRAMQQKPKLVILSHISHHMLRSNMYKQEKIISDATKVRCIGAEDFMEIDLDTHKIKILQPVKKI